MEIINNKINPIGVSVLMIRLRDVYDLSMGPSQQPYMLSLPSCHIYKIWDERLHPRDVNFWLVFSQTELSLTDLGEL